MDNNEVCEILLNWNLQNIKIEKIYNTAWQAANTYIHLLPVYILACS